MQHSSSEKKKGVYSAPRYARVFLEMQSVLDKALTDQFVPQNNLSAVWWLQIYQQSKIIGGTHTTISFLLKRVLQKASTCQADQVM